MVSSSVSANHLTVTVGPIMLVDKKVVVSEILTTSDEMRGDCSDMIATHYKRLMRQGRHNNKDFCFYLIYNWSEQSINKQY